MRIISVTLRNCRVHRELKVDFDSSRTLIGGPNETGKSTLIESVHRALFLKAKGNTEQHRALSSSLHSGHPEVEMTFECGGRTYLLKKRFGSSGTTTLAPPDSVLLSGDAAESELARLLGVEAGIAGKAVTIQWAHLWVWQGQAGDDPSAHATTQVGGLLQRLQQIGGAAAIQSELDARMAKHFADAKDQIYTQAGKPKTGSELERADNELFSANEQLSLAMARVERLDSSAGDLENATRDLQTTGTSLAGLEKQHEVTESKARKLGELRQQETEQFHAAKEAGNRHATLDSANQQILTASADVAKLEKTLEPQKEKISRLEKARDEAKYKTTVAEKAYHNASSAVRAARLRQELASAHTQLFEKTEVHTQLSTKAKKVSKRLRDLANLEEELAKLPKVDKTKLHKIQKLEAGCSNARAALQAMATGIEVVAADKPVKAGSQSLEIGKKQILTEDTEVSIGTAVRLRIQPGGGISLSEARQTEQDARKDLEETLDSLGLHSVPEATEVYAGRDDLGSRIKAAKAELDGMGVENLGEEAQSAQNDLAAAKATVERLAALALDEKTPEDKAAAKILAKAADKKLRDTEDLESEAKTNRDRSAGTLASSEETLNKNKTETEEQGNKLIRLQAELSLLRRTHGDDMARTQALTQSQSAKTATKNLLKATTDAIAALQPDLLESDRIRIARAIKARTNDRNEARTKIAVAQAALISDGSEDPQAARAIAEVKARSANLHRNSVQRKSQAVALLDKLFQEEQRTLSEQFTQPLADKISGYLQCIFGVGARAQVDLENNEFCGLRLSRPGFGGAPFVFETLSGGAKEQTAAAVRLAVAEVLAVEYGGCLPVVFDDAFAYSDPERVNTLQRMLDLAATRGLQVVVLTCKPADYMSLGAKTVALRSERYTSFVSSNPAPESEIVSSEAISAHFGAQLQDSSVNVSVTDELRQALLNALSNLGGSKGNQSLREELGWDDATYSVVKNDLVAAGKMVPGKGRGGSVSLPNQ